MMSAFVQQVIPILIQMPAIIDRDLNIFFIAGLNAAWSIWGKVIIMALALDALIIIIKLIVGGTNKMPPFINYYVGKVTYLLFAAIIYAILYLLLDATVIDWKWFLASCALSYPITKIFLRDILGFWDY